MMGLSSDSKEILDNLSQPTWKVSDAMDAINKLAAENKRLKHKLQVAVEIAARGCVALSRQRVLALTINERVAIQFDNLWDVETCVAEARSRVRRAIREMCKKKVKP